MARIVVADSQSHFRGVLKRWLTHNGHEVIEAASGRAALEQLRQQRVDVLISDVALHDMDRLALVESAFAVCQTLRRAFVVTASGDLGALADRACDPRVSVHGRPFSPSRLLHDLESALREAGVRSTTACPTALPEVVWSAQSTAPPTAPGGQA